jgi:NAD(P)-dependent dehydrogenase (short-subunit alcohol dehydrogenase family)
MDDLRRQMEVNVIGQVAVLQAMLPLIRAARGRIVNMSSISGRVAAPYMGPYAASKHALEAISDCLRAEMRPFDVSVSVVEPGSVQTPIWSKALGWADRIVEIMPPAAEAVYGEEIDIMRQSYENLAAGAMPVERVVRAVVHALTARRPRTRYPVGLQTRAAFFWFPFLGDRARDWCIRIALGLNKKR